MIVLHRHDDLPDIVMADDAATVGCRIARPSTATLVDRQHYWRMIDVSVR